MSIIHFKDITEKHQYVGGKAHALGLMMNAGLPVPPGLALTAKELTEGEWKDILHWWATVGNCPLAVRSSAQGEDSGDQSFAGQNSTFLNIDTEQKLKSAINRCFESFYKHSSQLYRVHFLGGDNHATMNVVLQAMVNPDLSGVFFSIDPRSNEKKWILECIEGYGEDLVSGKKTPDHYEAQTVSMPDKLKVVVEYGLKVRDYFQVEIDMEWAIDKQGKFWILQARPVTALSGKSTQKKWVAEECERLISTHNPDTIWDGKTFAEWSGPPTELTFSIWREAFARGNAFSRSLRKLGYLGIETELANETHSLLEKIFGRAYVNASMLAPLYFGPIPYRLVVKKQGPAMKFDYHRMTVSNFVSAPFIWWRMLKIGWDLSTNRAKYIEDIDAARREFEKQLHPDDYSAMTLTELSTHFSAAVKSFYQDALVNPLTLIILIQSTMQTLKGLLKGVLPDEEDIEKKLAWWMSQGLNTETFKMNQAYLEACNDPAKRASFLKHYGHRGPGELELSHPRWEEMQDKAFHEKQSKRTLFVHQDVEKEIDALGTYKASVIKKEWQMLKRMLELREEWKNTLLAPYHQIRLMALAIAHSRQIDPELLFWHDYKEIEQGQLNPQMAKERKKKAAIFKNISLPSVIELSELEKIATGDSGKLDGKSMWQGTPLSPGIAFGEIRVVQDPEHICTEDWPENVILVAESTDPGWTGLFLKSKAVIVEKGGVLSHCAIVAREMNLPAVSEIYQCHLRFKDGEKIWVDGNNGLIRYQ